MVLLFLAFLFLFGAALYVSDSKTAAFLKAYCLYEVCVLYITEITGRFNLIQRSTFIVAWLMVSAAALLFCVYMHFKLKRRISFHSPITKKVSEKTFTIIIVAILSLYFVYALFTPLNNWDSYGYHLPRIMHWIQNKNVDYYATHTSRQLFSPCMAEYNLLQSFVLDGNDRFSNLVQYASLVVTIVSLSGIMKSFRISALCTACSAFLILTMPMIMLQSGTTQTDLYATGFVFISIYFIMRLVNTERLTLNKQVIQFLVFAASAIGLGYLGKGTSSIAVIPFLIWLFAVCLKRKDTLKSIFMAIGIAGSVIFLLCIFGFIRNYQFSGSILGVENFDNVLVSTLSPGRLLTNLYTNYCLQWTLPLHNNELYRAISSTMIDVGNHIASFLGAAINDPSITFGPPFTGLGLPVSNAFYLHDYAGNPFITLASSLAVICGLIYFILSLFKGRKVMRGNPYDRRLYVFMAICFTPQILLMIGVKWQPWGTRLLLPSTALLAIPTVIVIEKLTGSLGRKRRGNQIGEISGVSLAGSEDQRRHGVILRRTLAAILILASCLSALPVAAIMQGSVAECISSDIDYSYQYISKNDQGIAALQIADVVKQSGAHSAGLVITDGYYEYALWLAFAKYDMEINHINVSNKSSRYENMVYVPDSIIFFYNGEHRAGDKISVHETEYVCTYAYESYSVFIKSN